MIKFKYGDKVRVKKSSIHNNITLDGNLLIVLGEISDPQTYNKEKYNIATIFEKNYYENKEFFDKQSKKLIDVLYGSKFDYQLPESHLELVRSSLVEDVKDNKELIEPYISSLKVEGNKIII